jgi:urease accessory protein
MVAAAAPPRAPGRGELVLSVAGGKTVVARARAESPLKLLCPRSHGEGRWAFLATFGGGLVDGDALELDVTVERGARALLGTQASTKVYRSPRVGARQVLRARVDDDALLAVLPDHVACFAGSRYEQRSTYVLAPTASLVLLDVLSCGRAAHGERWAFARYASRTRVERVVPAAKPGATCRYETIALDALELDPTHGDLAARMGRFDALATLFAFGPAAAPIRAALLSAAEGPLIRRADHVAAASPLSDDGVVLRAAGVRVDTVLSFAREALAGLGTLFGDDPFARKW